MREITEAEKEQIWKEVKEEFPEDEMMQEIHYIRKVHYLLTKDLSTEDRIKFYNSYLPVVKVQL